MTSKKRLLAVALAGVLLLSSISAAGVVRSAAANDSLDVAVEGAGNDGATVSVTMNGSTVENASVTVEAANDRSYAGVGNYTTDENGTVALPEPEEDVTVKVTAETGNQSAVTTAELSATEESDESGESDSFGAMVSSFVQGMLNAGDDGGPLGQVVSEYVTENNPGADEKSGQQGKPDDAGAAGNSTAGNSSDEKGSQGPPEHAGNGNQKNDGEETTTTTSSKTS